MHHPQLFGATIGISPSIWWDDESLLRTMGGYLGKGTLKDKKLFYSIASEGGQFDADLQRFHSILAADTLSGLLSAFRQYPDETHTSSPAMAYYDAFRFIFADRALPISDTTAAQVQAYYRQLSGRYGYPILPPEGLVNGKGYELLERQRLDGALTFFLMNSNNYPHSANVFDSLGDGYLALGNPEKAAVAFSKALELDDSLEETRKKLSVLKK